MVQKAKENVSTFNYYKYRRRIDYSACTIRLRYPSPMLANGLHQAVRLRTDTRSTSCDTRMLPEVDLVIALAQHTRHADTALQSVAL